MGTLIFMSSTEVIDTSESKVAAVVMIIWIFSILGWLINPSVVGATGLSASASQYGIAILATIGGAVFIFRDIFRLIIT